MRRQDQRIDMDEVEALAKEHKPKLIVAGGSAYPRIIDFAALPQDRGFRRRLFHGRHGAFRRSCRGRRASQSARSLPMSSTTTTHKTLRGPRGGMILSRDAELGKKINSAVFPGLQGGPLMHVIAAKAVAFGEALRPEFKLYARAVVENAKALAETLAGVTASISSRAAPTRI